MRDELLFCDHCNGELIFDGENFVCEECDILWDDEYDGEEVEG